METTLAWPYRLVATDHLEVVNQGHVLIFSRVKAIRAKFSIICSRPTGESVRAADQHAY